MHLALPDCKPQVKSRARWLSHSYVIEQNSQCEARWPFLVKNRCRIIKFYLASEVCNKQMVQLGLGESNLEEELAWHVSEVPGNSFSGLLFCIYDWNAGCYPQCELLHKLLLSALLGLLIGSLWLLLPRPLQSSCCIAADCLSVYS